MNLTSYTRRLEECRRRWNCRSLQYVLGVARIVRAARRAAKDKRRWCRWIREETRMSRITVHRYLRVAEFLGANVSLKKQMATLGIFKIYALSRLNDRQARSLIRSGKAERMSDAAFQRIGSPLRPRPLYRPTLPNLKRSLEAAVFRLERSLGHWQTFDLRMPPALQSRLQAKLQAMSKALDRIRMTSAAAM
jgi:hypothetical protein